MYPSIKYLRALRKLLQISGTAPELHAELRCAWTPGVLMCPVCLCLREFGHLCIHVRQLQQCGSACVNCTVPVLVPVGGDAQEGQDVQQGLVIDAYVQTSWISLQGQSAQDE